jgi:hypothetical protein
MFALVAAVAVVGCGGGNGPVMIALDGDFAPYASWSSVYLGDNQIAGHPPGPRYGYLNMKAPAGAKKYPVGTIIVKEIHTNGGTDPTTWDLFSMVKRGGGFNDNGALDWEFFILHLDQSNAPTIVARGTAPADASAVDGGTYGVATNGQTCNVCHAGVGADQTDFILSPLLQPGAQ